jgi:two-component system chemotaxis response regulator CheB
MGEKNILIVDDSALMRRLISDIIKSDKRFVVKDIATNGIEALELVQKSSSAYDCIILDINMPKMNGLEFLDQLQKKRIKATVIVVSTLAKEGAKETILALERGAFDFVTKPENYLDAKEEHFKKRLLETLFLAIGLTEETSTAESQDKKEKPDFRSLRAGKIIEREETKRVVKEEVKRTSSVRTSFEPHKRLSGSKSGKNKLIALACSTGGPKSLQLVIPYLPHNLDAPVVLVQHMPKGFTNSLAQRLNEMSKVSVKEAADGDILKKGHVYLAPGGLQMRIAKQGSNYKIVTTEEPARDGLRPCANIMYESLVDSDFDEITCVVLTGMGSDGTKGIGLLGENKNVYVIAQDNASSVVYGMPKAVADAGLVDEVHPLENIADAIIKNVGVLSDGR